MYINILNNFESLLVLFFHFHLHFPLSFSNCFSLFRQSLLVSKQMSASAVSASAWFSRTACSSEVPLVWSVLRHNHEQLLQGLFCSVFVLSEGQTQTPESPVCRWVTASLMSSALPS